MTIAVFNEIFGDFFGRKPGTTRSQGKDRNHTLRIDFITAALGGERVIDITREGFRLVELSPGVDFDFVQDRTAAPLLPVPESCPTK